MPSWTDERLERMIATLLLTGVLLSTAVVVVGGVCYLTHHGRDAIAYRVFHEEPIQYRSVSGVAFAVTDWDCGAVIQLGLLLLIATPVARVAFSLVGFTLQGDRTYMLITLLVLAILLFSLISGR
jgi:uncharacterized membrane protein